MLLFYHCGAIITIHDLDIIRIRKLRFFRFIFHSFPCPSHAWMCTIFSKKKINFFRQLFSYKMYGGEKINFKYYIINKQKKNWNRNRCVLRPSSSFWIFEIALKNCNLMNNEIITYIFLIVLPIVYEEIFVPNPLLQTFHLQMVIQDNLQLNRQAYSHEILTLMKW